MTSYLPHPARITTITSEAADTRTLVLALEPPVPALDAANPGQFVMLSVLGHGEAAFSLSALPGTGAAPGTVVVTVRCVGRLTSALFGLEAGARIGVRGPFGHGFSLPAPSVPTLFVAGGCGLSPLKAAIDTRIVTRRPGTAIAVAYGASDPATRIHRAALERWAATPDVEVVECVADADVGWTGRHGVVTDLLPDAVAASGARWAGVCGPPRMLLRVAEQLCTLGLAATAVHLAIERYMKCGTGHCGHCYVNDRLVCRDGPVFSFADLRSLPDAFGAIAAADHAVSLC